jgi:DNA-binding winged helix-turn-helix (wHTH) protein
MTNSKVFPVDFCQETTNTCLKLINASCSFTLRSMPGLGVSFFLKHLMQKQKYFWVPLNLYELQKPKPQTLIHYLANYLGFPLPGKNGSLARCIEDRMSELAQKHERVVLIFNRYDALEQATGSFMLNALRSIRDINREKIVCICATSKSLSSQLKPKQMDCLNLFAKEVFLKPYRPKELNWLLTLDKSATLVGPKDLQQVIFLSGGHHSLAQTLLRCQSLANPLGDPMVRLQLDYILSCLTPSEAKMLILESSRTQLERSHSLIRFGFVVDNYSQSKVFTSLVSQHLKTKHAQTLPPKEKALLSILQKHAPNHVSKDELIDKLWNNTRDGGSEWALTALLYRLRKHPSFIASGDSIVTYKKRGYALVEQ